MNANQQPLLFVVGVGRSGTTLMQVLLAGHSQIAFIPEINFIRTYWLKGTLDRLAKRSGMAAVANRLASDRVMKRLSFPVREVLDDLDTASSVSDCILERILQRHTTDDSRYVGYKDARLVENLDALLQHWPTAKFVHIFRDPRDVLASRKKANWSKDYPNWRNLVAGRVQLTTASRFSKRYDGERIINVKYEELISQPEAVARDLCTYLGLDFEPKMLATTDQADSLVFESEMQFKKNLFSPVMAGNSGKWRDSLTASEIALTESVFQRDMKERGYELSHAARGLNVGQRAQIAATHAFILCMANGYRWRNGLSG